jgi:hypothetical protein
MAKEKKKRADQYDPKLAIKEGFEFIDVVNASLGIKTKTVKIARKAAAKKKG